MSENTRGDIRIAGLGTVVTGQYRAIRIEGSGTLTGDIDCESFRVAGAADGTGSLKAGSLSVAGSLHHRGYAEVGDARVNGTASFGRLKVGTLKVAGSADAEGDVSATEIGIQGSLRVGGDCQAERFRSEGAFEVGGLLNAGAVDVTLWGKCRAGDIGGESITVRLGKRSLRRLVAMFVPQADDRLTTETIEGDEVRLENTTARVVRGGTVVIGPKCDIGLVEYTGSYSASPDARVKEYRQVSAEAPAGADEGGTD